MLLQTILNKVHPLKSFVYSSVKLMNQSQSCTHLYFLIVQIIPRKNSKPVCSGCGKKSSGYDKQKSRDYLFVSIWGLKCYFRYSPRRVNCKRCGVLIEAIPWSDGKSKLTLTMRLFLAQWAKKMSWKDVSTSFNVSWESVFRSVKYVVDYGLKNRSLDGIKAIGIDEVKYKIGHQYLTLVYQIDVGSKRLIYIAKDRTSSVLYDFFHFFGKERTQKLEYICTDMWKAYLKVIREKAPYALNILDRFHLKKHLNEALNDVRKEEVLKLNEGGFEPILKNTRWALLKNPKNRTKAQATKIKELLRYNLKSIRCYLHLHEFEKFWKYTSVTWAEKFLDSWCTSAMRSKIAPLKAKVRILVKKSNLSIVSELNTRIKSFSS